MQSEKIYGNWKQISDSGWVVSLNEAAEKFWWAFNKVERIKFDDTVFQTRSKLWHWVLKAKMNMWFESHISLAVWIWYGANIFSVLTCSVNNNMVIWSKMLFLRILNDWALCIKTTSLSFYISGHTASHQSQEVDLRGSLRGQPKDPLIRQPMINVFEIPGILSNLCRGERSIETIASLDQWSMNIENHWN